MVHRAPSHLFVEDMNETAGLEAIFGEDDEDAVMMMMIPLILVILVIPQQTMRILYHLIVSLMRQK